MTELDAVPLHLNVDLESIPNQIGHAILRSANGSILKPPNGSLTTNDVEILYKMLLEMGSILKEGSSSDNGNAKEELLNKVTVQGGNGISYCLGVSKDGYVYIVKKRSYA